MKELSTITLLIQGHGNELSSSRISESNVHLLSFSGVIGKSGMMSDCPNGMPIDVIMLNYIAEAYEGITDPELQKEYYEKDSMLVNGLKEKYKECEIVNDAGFTRTFPRNDRIFYFRPNKHENHVKCIKMGDERCIEERDCKKKLCPEYGLTVVSSSNPSDYRYTLAGKTRHEKTSKMNWHMTLSTASYWRNKVESIPSDTEFYQSIFNSLDNKKIFLSNLVQLFKAMGYNQIFIIDPTCRDCKVTNWEKIKNRIDESRPPEIWGKIPFKKILELTKENRKRTKSVHATQVPDDRFEVDKHSKRDEWTVCDKIKGTCAIVVAGTALYYYLSSMGVLPFGFGKNKTKCNRRVLYKKKQSKRRE